jgi:hypothetical protein
MDNTEERVAEWIRKLVECQRFEDAQWNGLELYYGAICNANGDGIEFAPFLDEDCTMYTRQVPFSNYYSATYEEQEGVYIDYASYAKSSIETALGSVMSCSVYEAPQNDDGYGDDNIVEANEYCKKMFEESAIGMNDCNATAAEDENEDLDDDAFKWYSFDMTMESTDNIEQVCTKVKALNGQYYHAFKQASSSGGSSFHVAKSTSNEWTDLSSFAMSTLEICLLSAAMLTFAICWCRRRMMQAKKDSEMPLM